MKINKVKNKGFTLVELAIVMVIMGLIVMGALAGKELLHTSELNAIISEVESYKIAVDNFKSTYEGLPGDLKNATSFWTGGATTDGDGNGMIGADVYFDYGEPYTSWVHLSLAKMIAGSYSAAATRAFPSGNMPASRHITGAGYTLKYWTDPFTSGYTDALGRYLSGHYMQFGMGAGSGGVPYDTLRVPVINPTDAYYIDSKIDDGTPDYGSVIGVNPQGNADTCTTGSAPNFIYMTTNSTVDCQLFFKLPY